MITQPSIKLLMEWKQDPCDLLPVVLEYHGNFVLCFKPTRFSTESILHPVVIPFNRLVSYSSAIAPEVYPCKVTPGSLYMRAYRKKALLREPESGDLYVLVNRVFYKPSVIKTLMRNYKSDFPCEFKHESAFENLFGFIRPKILEQLYPGNRTYIKLLQQPFIAVKYDSLLITEQMYNLLGIELSDEDISILYNKAYVNANVLSSLMGCKLSTAQKLISYNKDCIIYTSDSAVLDENRRFKKYIKLSNVISYTKFQDRFYFTYKSHLIPDSLFYQDELFLKEPIARAVRQTLKEKLRLYLQPEIITQAVVA